MAACRDQTGYFQTSCLKINKRTPPQDRRARKHTEKMMLPEDPRTLRAQKPFLSAFAPFARSTWIHPHVPNDTFDRVCKNIWRRATEAEEELGGERSKVCAGLDSQQDDWAEEQQKETDDLGLSTQNEEDKQQCHANFILPCPYLSGPRRPSVAKPARALSLVMEEKIKQNEEQAKGNRNLEGDEEGKQRRAENSPRKVGVGVPQCGSGGDKQRSAPEPQPLAPNAACPVTEDHAAYPQNGEDPPVSLRLQRAACESEDEQDISSSADSNSSVDDDPVTVPGLRTCATDSSNDDSASDSNDCGEEGENETLRSSDVLSSDSEQDSPSTCAEKDFPPLSTTKAGIAPCPTEPPALGKMNGQWVIPLSFHPHDISAATLASGVTTHAQAPVQGKAEAPQANSKNSARPASPAQQESYDLLADFPALQPPKKPLALGVSCVRSPKTKCAKGKREVLPRLPHPRQESGASYQWRMENVPHEVSSICAGDQKSVLDLQAFGPSSQRNAPTISCEEARANNQLPPRVAGTDGVGGNARSWASAAKAGMKQAAAPQEKARPCTFQQIVTINRAKVRYSAAQNFTSKVTPSYQAVATFRGARPRNPNRFVRPGFPHTHQHFGAQTHWNNGRPGFRCPRFPLQP